MVLVKLHIENIYMIPTRSLRYSKISAHFLLSVILLAAAAE